MASSSSTAIYLGLENMLPSSPLPTPPSTPTPTPTPPSSSPFSASSSPASLVSSSPSSDTSTSRTSLSYASEFRTPKLETTSPMNFQLRDVKPFEDGLLGLRERKIHNGQSIAPNLLSIKLEPQQPIQPPHPLSPPTIPPIDHPSAFHGYSGDVFRQEYHHGHSGSGGYYHGNRMSGYQEYVPPLTRYPSSSLSPSSSNGGGTPSSLQYSTRIPSLFDCSQSFTSWTADSSSRSAAMTALELTMPKFMGCGGGGGAGGEGGGGEDDLEMSEEDSGRRTHTRQSPSPSLPPPPHHPHHSHHNHLHRPAHRHHPHHAHALHHHHRRRRRTPPLVVSNMDKPHVCLIDSCGKRFRRHEHLRRHEYTHTQEKPYPCPVCNRLFSRTDNLRAHKKTHMKQGGRNNYVPGLELI